MENYFKTLNAINVNDKVEKKKSGNVELSYLSWPWAVAEVTKLYPNWTYKIIEFDGKPWLFDENLGYLIVTEITIDGITKRMWLPVMNGANKSMRHKIWTYFVKGWQGKPDVEKQVEPATMFDVNTATMRCLVKNLAMFGLGLYIYAGEDLPEGTEEESVSPYNGKKQEGVTSAYIKKVWAEIKAEIEKAADIDDLKAIWQGYKADLEKIKNFDDQSYIALEDAKNYMKDLLNGKA